MLSMCNLSLKRQQTLVLNDINLSLQPGTVTVLMGPNGAGKSSLLQILGGELTPECGEVHLNGQRLEQWRSDQRARMMALLPQHSTLSFNFTVEEVVLLSRISHATGIREDREIVNCALRAVDADQLAGRLYPQLSGGEKQRVQLARVLAQIWAPVEKGGRLLVLDEPASAFDLAHQQLLKKLVRRFASEDGVTILMVVHDFNMAVACADQLILLKDGHVVASGSPCNVVDIDTVSAVFGVLPEIVPHPSTRLPLVLI